MPRAARIDYPGLLQHVIIRGNEQRKIFRDDYDRHSFVQRFSSLLEKCDIDCLAWALLDNHAHFLLRIGQTSLARFMRRLLTGHATTFNLRHGRSGHLFQNRYKSIVCDEETYLLELIRYIHLNPLRAGAVQDLEALNRYPWCGHGVLMGSQELGGQVTEEVLQRFSSRLSSARRRYLQFLADGMGSSQKELDEDGLRWLSRREKEEDREAISDRRVLGSADFVEQVLQNSETPSKLPALPIDELIQRVAQAFDLAPESLGLRKRRGPVVKARSVLCYLAVREMGMSGEAVGRKLKIGRAGVSYAADRGEALLAEDRKLRERIANAN
ncbi:MAG: transposase [Syntrophotaleaceae bacterium]